MASPLQSTIVQNCEESIMTSTDSFPTSNGQSAPDNENDELEDFDLNDDSGEYEDDPDFDEDDEYDDDEEYDDGEPPF